MTVELTKAEPCVICARFTRLNWTLELIIAEYTNGRPVKRKVKRTVALCYDCRRKGLSSRVAQSHNMAPARAERWAKRQGRLF